MEQKQSFLKWRNLEIQKTVGGPKERYEWGLDHINKSGFGRYLELTEYFGILFDVFEGKVAEDFYEAFFRDKRSYEWLQSAWEITENGQTLISYRGVSGLRFQEYTRSDGSVVPFYLTPDFRYSEKRAFPVGHLKEKMAKRMADGRLHQSLPDLNDFDDSFILWHSGRVWGDFPEEMRKSRIDVDLLQYGWTDPAERRCVVPVAFYNMYNDYKMFLFGHVGGAGSARGAREKTEG